MTKYKTSFRLGKQKYEDLKNLKCCLDLSKRKFYVFMKAYLDLYLVKTNIKYYFYLAQQHACFN